VLTALVCATTTTTDTRRPHVRNHPNGRTQQRTFSNYVRIRAKAIRTRNPGKHKQIASRHL
jgi:hypothetical protein